VIASLIRLNRETETLREGIGHSTNLPLSQRSVCLPHRRFRPDAGEGRGEDCGEGHARP